MKSYRFARRAFLASVGGAFGLEAMLRNLEAAAQGVKPPARFVLAHWPLGTMRYRFLPSPAETGSGYVASPIGLPFEAAGLRNDMTIFYGFSDSHLRCPGGGGAESGTPFTTTACNGEGTRENGGERDDGVAGGPSFDQVFLKNVPGLERGVGYVNSICDSRVDSFETSTQCLSYGYDARQIESGFPGGLITEYKPLLPQLSPARQYASLFANFMPGGATPENQQEALRALALRKSVLDYALGELARLKQLAPAAESAKIEIHAEAIRKLELHLAEGAPPDIACEVPVAPPDSLIGQTGNASYQTSVDQDDTPTHQAVAAAHMAIITAAFQCDLLRVATFQFAPATSHVAFKGMIPSNPERIAPHQPMSHAAVILSGGSQRSPTGLTGADLDAYEYMASVQTWYNQRMAEWLVKLKSTPDVFGGNLLDYTVMPFITERADGSSLRSPKPAFLFGGGKLGLKHGTFQNFSPARPQVDLYLTCAQALLGTANPLSVLSAERFVQFNPNAATIPGLWSPV